MHVTAPSLCARRNATTDKYLNNVPNTIPPMAGFIPEGSLKRDPLTATNEIVLQYWVAPQ